MNPMRINNIFGASRKIAWLMAVLVGASGLNGFAQQTNNAASRLDYASFKLITDRNIFNSYRTSRSSRSERRDSRKQVKADTFSLLGVMSYEKGTFAFFDGTSSDYRKTIKRSEAIAGYTVTDIAPNRVKLVSGTNQFELRVGSQMRREEDGEWFLVAQAESYPSQTSAATTDASTASSADADEVLKKLMQRREQELNR